MTNQPTNLWFGISNYIIFYIIHDRKNLLRIQTPNGLWLDKNIYMINLKLPANFMLPSSAISFYQPFSICKKSPPTRRYTKIWSADLPSFSFIAPFTTSDSIKDWFKLITRYSNYELIYRKNDRWYSNPPKSNIHTFQRQGRKPATLSPKELGQEILAS